ncbi:uncharacterized protein LOC111714025 [Eurytemora carolleeae]|uniref:uncharacterized protein LOC111714025 n=1 Tax=Eurytemora carolleeae TaxID=1294199 RepID=UPI000C7807D1|nr:uncharacterized protein LOC111714025 [Eurytemora carolleeae]|eukprot:XP_023344793.1 uncharacterized protein LOC111714025 [Eurytemora affinis]
MTIISFSAEDKTDSGYSFKPCDGKGLELGPGFQGLLYLSGGVKNKQKCFSSFNTQLGNHGVLQITGFKKTGPGVVPKNENLCSLVNLEYSLVEPNDLKQHICARDTQNLVEGRRMKEIEKDVNIEVEDNDDIVFIPSVDSNQAAPVNLKKFLASMEESISYDYLLVTTDRSLVNIDKVLNGLTGETSWWGSFNRFLPVQDYDLRFTAVSYPPIPSPSSVLSKHLADFIARNSESLADFSDVSKSLSIWLSGLGADYVDENSWFGGPEVVNRTQLWRSGQLIVLEDLVPEEMENVWKD